MTLETTAPSPSAGAAAPRPHPVEGGHPGAAAVIAVVAWGSAVLAVLLVVLAPPPLDDGVWFLLVDLTVACVYGTVAAVTLARRAHPVPWLLGLAGVGGGLAALGFAFEGWSAEPGGLPPVAAVAALQSLAWVPGTFALYLVVPWLVRDHPLGRARWGVALGALVTAGLTATTHVAEPLFFALLAASVPLGLAAAVAVELRRRRGPVEERNGLGWLALGTALLAVTFAPLLLPYGSVPLWAVPALHVASQAVFPAAVLVAVLRNRMWGLGLAVSRAVLAGVLTTGLLALYLVVTVALTPLLPRQQVAQLLGAAAVAVAVQPARLFLQRRVHRLVYGEASDPAQVVRRLGSQLVDSSTVEELLTGLAEDLGRGMRLASVTVQAPGVPPVRWGAQGGGEVVTVPLRHRGERVGSLSAEPRAGESLSGGEVRTLADLSSVVASAVAVARAATELDEARERLSRVRLHERRLVRRELHDGLGPSLAGIRLGLQGARNLLVTDPAGSAALLARLQDEVDAAVTGVRDLSHHLLPPALDELGLGPALEELAQRYEVTDLAVELHTDGLAGLDPRLAAAAYGIVSEAAVNAARHADAARCTIEARSTEAGLLLVVEDDGVGVPAGATPGVGTTSMRERAAEQGGTLAIAPRAGGGTQVTALLPWTRPEEADRG